MHCKYISPQNTSPLAFSPTCPTRLVSLITDPDVEQEADDVADTIKGLLETFDTFQSSDFVKKNVSIAYRLCPLEEHERLRAIFFLCMMRTLIRGVYGGGCSMRL